MELSNFNWDNGTQGSPIILTQNQIETLLAAKRKGVSMNVKGYINTNTGSIYKYLKYSLNQEFPELHILANEADDVFTLSAAAYQVNEGGEVQLAVSGITPDFINYVIEHNIQGNNSGLLSDDVIKSRITIDKATNKLKVADPQENASWADIVTIKAYPMYENPATSTNFQSVQITVTAVAIADYQIQCANRVASGNSFRVGVVATPTVSTKLAGATYVFSGTNGIQQGSQPNILIAPTLDDSAESLTCSVGASVYLFGHTTSPDKIISKNVTIYAGDITKYTINQKYNTENPITYHGTSDMIEDYVGAYTQYGHTDAAKVTINGKSEYKDVIARIRDHSHVYVGSYSMTDRALQIKQVSDEDKTKYTDGTKVTITQTDNLDVYMKLPQFWWKPVTLEEDVIQIEFCMTEADIDSTWFEWEGDTFIGVYEGISIDGKLYSKPNVTPTVNRSWTNFKADARNRSANHTLITFESHNIMALLGYGYLGDTDAQRIVGVGTSTYPKTTGLCDAKGMTDTTHGVDGETNSINFWALENWWGDVAEWVDNIQTANSTGLINILDKGGQVSRQVQAACQLSYGGEIGKFVFGDNADLIPKELHSNGNYDKAFADSGDVYAGAGHVARRSDSVAYLGGGLGFLYVHYSPGSVDGHIGSRLQYKGRYVEVDSFTND